MSAYRTGHQMHYAQAASQNFGVADVLRVARDRRKLILTIAASVVVLTILAVLAMPNIYSTTASVVLEQRKNSITDQASVIAPLTIDPATLQNQIQILASRDLALQVIEKLQLSDDPEFNPRARSGGLSGLVSALNPRTWFSAPSASQGARDEIVTNFLDHLAVEPAGLSTTLNITFWSTDAAKASRIAGAIAEAYVANQIARKVDDAQTTASWLNERVSDLSQQVQAGDELVQKYKIENKLADTNTGISGIAPVPVVDQQITAINTQLLQAKTVLAEKEAIYARVDTLVRAGNVGDVSTVVASPLIAQLRTQQADLVSKAADLSTRYGPLHPSIQAIETQKQELASKITQEALRIATSAGNDVVVARAHVTAMQNALAIAEKQAGTQNLARAKLRALESNQTSTRAAYESFVSRLRGVQNQDAIQSSEARVISHAPIPNAPIAPKRKVIVLASIPAGLMLGLLAALLMERFGPLLASGARQTAPRFAAHAFAAAPGRSAYSPPRNQTAYAGPPVIADIPNGTSPGAADFVIDWPQSAFTQAIKSLAAHVEKGNSRIVAIATPEVSSSGTVIAVALARMAAASGKKVLLVEADSNAKSARAMRLAPPTGLADVLLNRVSFARAITRDSRSDAYVLSNEHAPRNISAMFGCPQMAHLAGFLRETCDLVIVDAGPILGGNATVSSRIADATLVVSDARSLRRHTLTKALSLVRHSRATGVIIAR